MVDPVSLIVAALVAGAAAGDQDAVVSLYGRLKAALTGRAVDDPSAGKVLERHAGNPGGYEVPVRDLIEETGAARDEGILVLARQLLEAQDPAGARVGRYVVDVTGSQGVQVGENNRQTNYFGPVIPGGVQASRDVNIARIPEGHAIWLGRFHAAVDGLAGSSESVDHRLVAVG